MKHCFMNLLVLALVTPLMGWSGDLAKALEGFASYSFGQPKQILHDTRMTAFEGTQDARIRARHEQLLLNFLGSSATVDAKREACYWLSDLATPASRTAMEDLAKDPRFDDLAAVVLAALDALPVVPAAITTAKGRFKAEVLASNKPETLLITAIQGDDPALARLAFLLVEEGVASAELTTWLVEHAASLPPARQLIALNLLNAVDADKLAVLSSALARKGSGLVQIRAIQLSAESSLLTEVLGGPNPTLAEAAKQALIALPAASAVPALRPLLLSGETALQAKAIAIAAARPGTEFSKELEALAKGNGPNQKAAIRALGVVGDVGGLSSLLDAYVAAEGQPMQKEWQAAVWDMSRRQPDVKATVRVLEQSAEAASGNSKNGLQSMAKRLAGSEVTLRMGKAPGGAPKAVSPPRSENTLLPNTFMDLVPARFEVAAYLNCGPESKTSSGGLEIVSSGGKAFRAEPSVDPSLSLLFAAQTLTFDVKGLEDGEEYILGMTWWDDNAGNRLQSIALNGEEVLPAAPAICYDEHDSTRERRGGLGRPSPVRIQFALQSRYIKDGSCQVRVDKLRGPNVVVSEVWVLRRNKPKAEKQVLLIAGQDFPGHYWRKTSQVMQELITQDPRMEVTICETPYILGLQDLSAYDVMFLHFKNYDNSMPSTTRMQDNLEAFVRRGGGMCMSHFACGAFMEWPDFVNISGRIWSRGGHDPRGPFTVKVVDQQHPVTKGLGASFETDDELYWCLTGDTDIHLLCNAMSTMKKADQPQALVLEPGKGRTFLCTLGHDVKAYDAEQVRRLYRQGVAWAAKLD